MDLEKRIQHLETVLEEEISARIRAESFLEHRVAYMEANCLTPALARRINGPIPWLWRLLGLQWRPPSVS